MNREQCKELLPIMQAFAEGKVIQNKTGENHWVDCDNPYWSDSTDSYRIKPEETYRPFKDCDELIEWWDKHRTVKDRPQNAMPLIWLKHKVESDKKCIIIAYWDTVVFLRNEWLTLEYLFKNYEFLDGTPCGVKE